MISPLAFVDVIFKYIVEWRPGLQMVKNCLEIESDEGGESHCSKLCVACRRVSHFIGLMNVFDFSTFPKPL